MPPQRSIHVDTNQMIQSIADAAARQYEAAVERTRHFREQERLPALAESHWVKRDVQKFSGTLLTASQRKRWQESLVRLGVEGLVELSPSHVRLTDAALESLK